MSSATSFILSKTGQRKKTQYTKVLSKMVDKNLITSKMLDTAVDGYINKEDLFKNYGLNYVEYFNHQKDNKNLKSFEFFTDEMYKIGIKHKQKEILKDLKSAKNNLINNETERLAYDLAELNVSSNAVHNLIGKKIVGLNSSDELNSALRKHLEEIKGGWNVDAILESTKGLNIEIASQSDNKVIIEIKDFESCKELGSKSWCVVRDEYHYDTYTKEDFRRFFFIYDLDKMPEDELSMIATLVLPSGEISETYDKVDNKINNEHIRLLQKDLTPMSDNELKDKIRDISKGCEYERNRNYIKYGFYDDLRKILKEDEIKKVLIDAFNGNAKSNIVKAKTVKGFFDVFLKEAYEDKYSKEYMLKKITKCEVAEWVRECSFADDCDSIEHILKSPFVKDILANDDFEKYAEVDFNRAVSHLLSSDKFSSNEFAIKLIEELDKYNKFDMNNIISVSPMTPETLDYVEKKMPDYFKSLTSPDKFIENFDRIVDDQYTHHNEEWFSKLYEKLDTTKERDASQLLEGINAVFMRNLLNGYTNNRENAIMYGLQEYIGADKFKEVINEQFQQKNTVSMIFDFQEGNKLLTMVEKLYRFNNVEKLEPEQTLNMLSRINLCSRWKQFESDSDSKKQTIIQQTIGKQTAGQLSCQLMFLKKHKDKFDFSKCNKLFEVLSKHEGFEKIKQLNNLTVKKKVSLR